MDDCDSPTAIELLNGRIVEIRNLVDGLRHFSRSSDVPDVFETANALLIQLIPQDKDINMNQEEEAAQFDQMVSEKERAFIKKMDEKSEEASQKIDYIQRLLTEKEARIQDILTNGSGLQVAAMSKLIQHYYDLRVDKEKEYNTKKKELEDDEKNLYHNFEEQLAKKLSEVSSKYTSKIEDYNIKINAMQRDLQSLIHKKHQQNKIKADALASEDRRMASEHEKISREYQARKNAADTKIMRFSAELEKIHKAISDQNKTAHGKMDALEQAMISERKIILEQQQKQKEEIDKKIEDINNELANKLLMIESERAQSNLQLKDEEKEAKKKIEIEQKETQRLIDEATAEIDEQFKPIFEEIRNQIEEAENQRGNKLEILRQEILQNSEESEKEIGAIVSKYQDERDKGKQEIKQLKAEFDQVLDEKQKDLDALKKEMQGKLGMAMTETDEIERQHSDEINSIMQKFDEQQRKLTELHRKSLESRDKLKAEELARLKQEHEQRKNQLIFKIEQQIRVSKEQALASSIEAENQRHNKDIVSLKSRIIDIQSRIELLNMKFDGLYSMHGQRIEEIEKEAEEHQKENQEQKPDNIQQKDHVSIDSLNSQQQGENTERNNNQIETNAENIENEPEPQNNEIEQNQNSDEKLKDDKEKENKVEDKQEEEDEEEDIEAINKARNDELLREIQEGERHKEQMQQTRLNLLHQTAEVDRTKNMILKEVDQINTNLSTVKEDFEKKMIQISNQFLAQKSMMESRAKEVDKKHEGLQSKISDQKQKIDELTVIADNKENEAKEFEESIDSQKEAFQKETESSFQENLESIQKMPDTFGEELTRVNEDIQSRIQEVSKLIEEEKVNTDKTTKMLLNERDSLFKKVEKQINQEFEDRKQKIQDGHDQHMNTIQKDFDGKIKQHEDEMKHLQEEHDFKQQETRRQFNANLQELDDEKTKLEEESKELDEKIYELENTECPSCKEKRHNIRRLLQTRELLRSKLQDSEVKVEKSEIKVGKIFKGNQAQKTSSRSALQATAAKPKIFAPLIKI